MELSELGFGPFFEEQVITSENHSGIPARIATEHRGGYEVWSEEGSGSAKLPRKLVRAFKVKGFPGVGDWVMLKSVPKPDSTTLIERVFDRRTVFTRGAAGMRLRSQVVAANVDLVFVVNGLDGDYNVRRIERYLARILAGGASPAIVLNKADLCDETAARVSKIEERCPGVPVFLTSAVHDEGIDAIRALIGFGRTSAFVGSSGAGKSTMINRLLGEDRMATGAVRAGDDKGCHVTTHRQLLMVPGGGLLIDTPGMRELQMLDDEGVGAVFSDIETLAAGCRFADCRHESEPGCAVKAAMESGDISVDRFEHYTKLNQESEAFEARQSEQARRKKDRDLGRLYSGGDLARRLKRGE